MRLLALVCFLAACHTTNKVVVLDTGTHDSAVQESGTQDSSPPVETGCIPGTDADGDGSDACDDCDDHNAAAYPGRAEICDGIDNDCDGRIDSPWDADGDNYAPCGGDCDDTNPAINPGATEICDDLDNNCDGTVDEGFDADGDGFKVCRGDCDDADPTVYPWAAELCDGIDNDCDGTVDDPGDADGDGFDACSGDCDDTDATVYTGATELCDGVDNDCDGVIPADEVDADGDGVMVCAGDCADDDPARAAGFVEICDGQDNDCDDSTLETVDNDGDGKSACKGDCDDSDPDIHKGATEICDAVDDNCDGNVDEGSVCGDCTTGTNGGHVYLFCTDTVTWDSAHADCLSKGYDLVSLTDATEEEWVEDKAYSVWATQWYGGYTDAATEGTWLWSDGDTASYTDWAAGEPNDSGGEDCVELDWSGYQWNDCACSTALPYICESTD